MINISLLWYFLIPLFLSIVTIIVVKKYTTNIVDFKQYAIFTIGGFIISIAIMSGAFYAGAGSKTHDTQVLNGEILRKARTHDSYVRTYSCHCYTTCSGTGNNRSCTQHCQTCYENHYTVNWGCESNIGGFTIQHFDRTSKSVYNSPDPARWTIIKSGDPVSITGSYTNYIKAVPDSLFKPASRQTMDKYKSVIPKYPSNIYDFYHVDRVLTVGFTLPNIKEWNTKLSEVLKKLGPQKQANAVIVLTKYATDDFYFALQDAWINGKKNDIVVVIGAPDFPNKAAWVRVMALTKNDIFQVSLRDRILTLNEITADGVINSINEETFASFKRKSMKDFQYLESEIDPPTWVMVLASILITLAYSLFCGLFLSNSRTMSLYGIPNWRS